MDKKNELGRSRSLCSLDYIYASTEKDRFVVYKKYRSQKSDSSIEVVVVTDSDTDLSTDGSKLEDSGITLKSGPLDSAGLSNLEKKIDQLNNSFVEQCTLLTAIQNDVVDSKNALEKAVPDQRRLLEEMVNKIIAVIQSRASDSTTTKPPASSSHGASSSARTLLNAIECRRGLYFERELCDALTDFLQSEELKERVVLATAESVREVIRGCLSRDVSEVYLPALERSQRRLTSHVSRVLEDAFRQYENSTWYMKRTHRASRALRLALERHRHLLENCADTAKFFDYLQHTLEDILMNELKEWRQRVLHLVTTQTSNSTLEQEAPPSPPTAESTPASPQLPPNRNLSVIDQLMLSAQINKLIQDGEINASFEKALSSSDLSLVMVACRAVNPRDLFTRDCKLEQAVLLSLVQQLSTDLVHETQLKCRYLEDAIIHLNAWNSVIRPYLPLVMRNVRMHLMRFLESYPGHVASRRVSLIVMAAGSLLK